MKTNRNSLDLSKVATSLVNNKWMLSAIDHANLCKSVEKAMTSDSIYSVAVDDDTDDDQPFVTESNVTNVISISGVLSKGVSLLEETLLGLTDVDAISDALDQSAADPNVKDIVLAISSPGGETTGIEELGRKIKRIDQTVKPIYVWCESRMCSAAYWLGSQGRQLGMSPSAQVGSIGVYMLILDETKRLENAGVKVEAISSGKFKMMGHEFRSLTQEERDLLQADVNKQHQKFKDAVLSTRPQVNTEAMEGLSYEGEDALKYGLVDTVCDSFEEFLGAITK